MKKNKLLIGILLSAQLLGLSSCSDWLELSPENTIAKGDYWKSKEDVQSALTGVYISLCSTGNRFLLWGELRGDMMTPRYDDAAWNLIRRGEISPSNSYSTWSMIYSCINDCNLLLKYADQAQDNDASFTDEDLHSYKAQALAVRGLLYFQLVRTFGDVPFNVEGYDNTGQYLPLAKTSGDAILASIVTDLEAIVNDGWIPTHYSNTDVAQNKGYMTRYAVQTLLADIYLWQEEYQKCVNACDEVLNSGQFALLPVEKNYVITIENDTIYYASESGVGTYFNSMYVSGNCVESIFEFQFDRDFTNSFYNNFVGTRCTMVPNTEHLPDLFIPTELEGMSRSYVDMRSSISSKLGYIWKWAGPTYESVTPRASAADMTNHQIIYRLAQVYLMKAEALTQLAYESKDQEILNEALDLVNEIRERAGAVETTAFEVVEGQDIEPSGLEAYILEEEAREFTFEGKRWYDVIRHARRANYRNTGYLMQIVPYSVQTDMVYKVQVKYKDYNSWYMPLPQSDIESNRLLKQNPFYDSSTKK